MILPGGKGVRRGVRQAKETIPFKPFLLSPNNRATGYREHARRVL